MRLLWFLACPVSQQDSLPVSQEGCCEGRKGKEAYGKEGSLVPEGQMLSVSYPDSCLFEFCSEIAVITDAELVFPSFLSAVASPPFQLVSRALLGWPHSSVVLFDFLQCWGSNPEPSPH